MMMNLEFLKQFDFTNFDLKTLAALIELKSAKASDLCRQQSIPSSKIYISLDKLISLGIAEEVDLHPKIYSLVPTPEFLFKLEQLNLARTQEFTKGLQQLKSEMANIEKAEIQKSSRMGIVASFEDYRDKHLSRIATATGKVYSYINFGENYKRSAEAFFETISGPKDPNTEHVVIVSLLEEENSAETRSWIATHDIEVRFSSASLGTNFHFWDQKYAIQTFGNNLTGVVGSYYTESTEIFTTLWEGFMTEWYSADV